MIKSTVPVLSNAPALHQFPSSFILSYSTVLQTTSMNIYAYICKKCKSASCMLFLIFNSFDFYSCCTVQHNTERPFFLSVWSVLINRSLAKSVNNSNVFRNAYWTAIVPARLHNCCSRKWKSPDFPPSWNTFDGNRFISVVLTAFFEPRNRDSGV